MFGTQAEAEAAAKEMGCSGAHQMGSMWMACSSHMSDNDNTEPSDIPTLESSLNIKRKLTSINGSFIDLSTNPKDRGYGSLIGQTANGKEYAYYIDTQAVQKGSMKVFNHRKISLNPGESYVGTDKVDQLTGSKNNDTMLGKGSNDALSGRNGDDLLKGASGNDRLDGGRGNDRIIGGSGSNVVIGGAGRNTFVVGKGEDTIQDLNLNNDVIELSGNYQIVALGSDSKINFKRNDFSVLVLGITADDLTNSDVIHKI
jgi:Ca2+-binding RTX toxin-like protein